MIAAVPGESIVRRIHLKLTARASGWRIVLYGVRGKVVAGLTPCELHAMTKQRKYIEAAWDSYQEMVVPKNAGDAQIAETRQAFYSGASVLFQLIITSLEQVSEETEADLQLLTDIDDEITAFGQQLDRNVWKKI